MTIQCREQGLAGSAGFALVISLMLMAFLLLLILSLTTLAQLETRQATQALRMDTARENARLGLQEALGTLQATAGSDQRVSARAEILGLADGGPNPYWTGVWDVAGDDLLDYAATADTTKRNASTGKLEIAPTWLVSFRRWDAPDALPDPAQSLASVLEENEVVTLVSGAEAIRPVEAGRKPAGASGNYAWWIGDEGVKAKANTSNHAGDIEASGADSVHLRDRLGLYSARRHGIERLEGAEDYPVDDPLWRKALSNGSLATVATDGNAWPGVDEDWLRENQHNLTLFSRGVLSDSLRGGLKLDLSRGLEEDWPRLLEILAPEGVSERRQNSGNINTGLNRPAIVATRDEDGNLIDWAGPRPVYRVPGPAVTGGEYDGFVYGPYWDILYDYYQLHKPWPPYTVILNIRSDDSTRSPRREFLGYQSGRPPHAGGGDADWYKSYGDERINQPSLAIGVGKPFGIDQPASFGASLEARAGGPGYAGHFIPTAPDPDEGQWWHHNFFALPAFPDLERYPDGFINQNNRNYSNQNNRQAPMWNVLTPVRLRSQLVFGIESYEVDPDDLAELDGDFDPEDGPFYRFRLQISPTVVLWNPYNVRLSLRPTQLLYRMEDFRMQIYVDEEIYFDSRGEAGGPLDSVDGSNDPEGLGVYLNRILQINSPSKYFQYLLFVADGYMFEPGEVRVFSLAGNHELSIDHTDIRNEARNHWLVPEFVSGRHAWLDLEYSPIFGKPASGNDRERRPTDPVPASGQVEVRLFPPDDGTFGDDRGQQMRFSFRLPFDDPSPQPIVLAEQEAVFFQNQETLSLGSVDILGVTDGLSQPYLSVLHEIKEPADQDAGNPLFLTSTPRALNQREVTDTAAPFQLFRSNWAGQPPASVADAQVKPGTTGRTYFGGEPEIVAYDVPRQPLHSVGDFMHANVSFFNDLPNYPVGGGHASPHVSDRDAYLVLASGDTFFPDIAYLLNHALFDRFFFSTVPVDWENAPSVYGDYPATQRDRWFPFDEDFDADYIDANRPLPNPRMAYHTWEDEDSDAYLEQLRDVEKAASRLWVDGAFNINSTSVEAWKAILGASTGSPGDTHSIRLASGGNTTLSGSDLDNPFTRFTEPMGEPGDNWRGYRTLSGNELERLAGEMIDEVKNRGPFSSLADFVNRRLVNGDYGERGSMQAAIDRSGINSGINNSDRGSAGYLLQNDLLRTLAPILSARSDTFVIRAYGDAVNPVTGELEASAFCEALVQRMPAFLDRADAPETRIDELSEINQRFGRRFEIIDFRWLSENEI